MELILISSNKLKVILTEEEMEKYNLNSVGATDKRLLSSLLDDIKRKSGFNTDNGSIYIELFESLRGGCEIFITREAIGTSPSKSEAWRKSAKESIITYKFDNAEDVISASRILLFKNLIYESRLFSDEHGSFYLLLTFKNGFKSDDTSLIFLNEFGVRTRAQFLREYLDEHGKLICEPDAVAQLAKL